MCEHADLIPKQSDEQVQNLGAEDARASASSGILPATADEACQMMREALKDLDADTLSGEDAWELCQDGDAEDVPDILHATTEEANKLLSQVLEELGDLSDADFWLLSQDN